jgi:catechol 2,3-dioxygenase-like lactoylglutathione lyase family enzyme
MKMLGVHHIGIVTARLAELEAFYVEVLGLPVAMRWDEARIIFIELGGAWLELIGQQADAPARPAAGLGDVGLNHIALRVDDVDAAYHELLARGARAVSAPEDFQTVRIAFVADPDGNVVEVVGDVR